MHLRRIHAYLSLLPVSSSFPSKHIYKYPPSAIITGDRSSTNVITHELSHSWFGNGVTWVLFVFLAVKSTNPFSVTLMLRTSGWMKDGRPISNGFCWDLHIPLHIAVSHMPLVTKILSMHWSCLNPFQNTKDLSLNLKLERTQTQPIVVFLTRRAQTFSCSSVRQVLVYFWFWWRFHRTNIGGHWCFTSIYQGICENIHGP